MRPSTFDDDLLFAEQCLSGRPEALERFRGLCSGWLRGWIATRGGTVAESDEITQTLFVDCAAAANGRLPLLATFRGECPLRAWLTRVALSRLITRKREAQRDLKRFGPEPDAPLETLPVESHEAEEPVLALLREALARAFAECEAEQYVMLQLLHADDLRQQELAQMFGCAISTISRNAEAARREVRAQILAEIRRRDPWLDLTWDDLLALCRTTAPEQLPV